MISNTERREVAQRLREIFPYYNSPGTIPKLMQKPAAEYLTDLARALGYSPKNDVSRIDFQNHLADLIEPSEPRVKCVAEPDSWSSVWADVSNGNETPGGMMRRCKALAERSE